MTQSSLASLSSMVDQAPVGIAIIPRDTLIVEIANENFLRIVGQPRETILSIPFWEIFPHAKAQYGPIMQRVFDTGIPWQDEGMRARAVAETMYVSFLYEPLKNEAGEVTRIMILSIDVTPQILARKRIEEEEETKRLALDLAELGLYEINLVTREMTTDDRFNQIWKITPPVTHPDLIDTIHPEDQPLRKEAHENALVTGLLAYEGRVLRHDGSATWIRVRGRVVYDNEGKPVRLLGVLQDITEQKKFNEALEQQVRERTGELETRNRELQLSNSHLEEFVYAASHDLKEPIRKIHYFTDRLREQLQDRLTADETSALDRMENAGRRMALLIDDLLIYSQVSDKVLEMESIDLNQKLRRVLDDLEVYIVESGASITLDHLPVVKGHRRQLQQLFQNLISNALKYHKPGIAPEIHVHSSRVTENDGDFHLIEVSDKGIGFDPAESERIFKMFQRLHNAADYQGTGIGLSIARKVVENHGGRLTAKSRPGEGSTFRVWLPA